LVSIWQSTQPYIEVSWRANEQQLAESLNLIRVSIGTIVGLGGVFAGDWKLVVPGSADAETMSLDDLDDAALLDLIQRGVDRNHDGSAYESGGYAASLVTLRPNGTGAAIELRIGASSDQPNSGSLTLSIMQPDRDVEIDVSGSLGAHGRRVLEALVDLWHASSARLGVTKANRAQRKYPLRLGLTTFLRHRPVPFTLVRLPATVEVSQVEDGVWIEVRPGTEELHGVIATVVDASSVINQMADSV